ALTVPSGPALVAIALGGLALGLAYDLRLKRTPLAWLPFAVGIPLLVLYAWLGGAGDVRPGLLAVLPAGGLAGAAIALGNALVDPEADRLAGLSTPVVVVGERAAWVIALAALAGTIGTAVGSLVAQDVAPWLLAAAVASGTLAVAGLALVRSVGRDRRERGWELEAVGLALLGAVWAAGLASR
ncbi:MAG TPA: UbiA family prenyltransferase, partial [Candidatus Dormibacteraeota bacterium]|nr:UbiA family prenyltransferase [Candidatus Dormibacteraeota bacterium]